MAVLDERDLDSCVRCGLCLTSCPTFELTGMEGYSPRGRIRVARRLSEGPMAASPVARDYLDTCLGCRACEAVCPSGVPYGRILEGVRAEVPPRGIKRRIVDAMLLWLVARRWRLSVASLVLYPFQKLGFLRLGRRMARRGWGPRALAQTVGIPRLRLRDLLTRMSTNYEPRRTKEQVVLFAGCIEDAWYRDVHWATISVLTRCGYRVRMPHGQVCCGALHAHAGRIDAARNLARRNADALAAFEGPVLVSAAGCGAKVKEYEDLLGEDGAEVASRAKDWSEIVSPEEIAALGPRPPEGLERIAFHDACHARHAQGIVDGPRELLRAAGYEVVELSDAGRCCGAAGTYAVHEPEWADALRAAKLDAYAQAAPDAVAVANPGCRLWMSAADGVPSVYHPMQLLAVAILNGGREARAAM